MLELSPNKIPDDLKKYFKPKLQYGPWVRRNTLIWWKRNCMPSSARDRFTVDFEYVYFFCKSGKYWFERQFEPHARLWDESNGGSISTGRMSTAGGSMGDMSTHPKGYPLPNPLGRNTRCVWDIPTAPFKDAHFATFPEKLVSPMIRAGCPEFVCEKCGKAREKIYQYGEPETVDGEPGRSGQPHSNNKKVVGEGWYHLPSRQQEYLGLTDCGCAAPFRPGVVLDPFAGAGTVGVVAKKLDRDFIGIELNPEYITMADSRIAAVKVQGKLFKEV